MGTLKNNASSHFYYSGYMNTRIWRDFNAFLMEDSSHAKCKICVKGGSGNLHDDQFWSGMRQV